MISCGKERAFAWRFTSTALALLGATAGGACAGDDVGLTPEIPCAIDNPCPQGSSCLVNTCIGDATLEENEPCSIQRQCGENLVCLDFVCRTGCADLYYKDDCPNDDWCKPRSDITMVTSSGRRIPLGECAPSECDPSQVTFCQDGSACVAVTATIGACLPYCTYGFSNGEYVDTCEDTVENNYACQPLGLTKVPVCLPSGDAEAPALGEPGCDAVRNPCAEGSICFDVVCRRLCTNTQITPCPSGEACLPVGNRADVSYCSAQ